MKKHAITLLVLALVALPGLASARTGSVITAQVPFDFVAKGQAMAAGSCSIAVTGNSGAILLITCGNKHVYALPMASESARPSENTSLLFRRYGDRYFFAGVKQEGESRGYEIPASKLERELRAQNVTESDVTIVAAAN